METNIRWQSTRILKTIKRKLNDNKGSFSSRHALRECNIIPMRLKNLITPKLNVHSTRHPPPQQITALSNNIHKDKNPIST